MFHDLHGEINGGLGLGKEAFNVAAVGLNRSSLLSCCSQQGEPRASPFSYPCLDYGLDSADLKPAQGCPSTSFIFPALAVQVEIDALPEI